MGDAAPAPSSGTDVLVTGATGFLGSHLVRRLVAEGVRVHAVVRARSSRELIEDVTPAITCWTLDLRDEDAVARCLSEVRPRVVFHLAGVTRARPSRTAFDPDLVAESYAVNLTGTLNLLLALTRRGSTARVVRVGSLAEYGDGPVPYGEQQREAPLSAYAASQVAATHLARMLHRQSGLDVVTLRLGLIYGPGQSAAFFIPALILACLEGRPFDMSAGNQTRDYVYVDDAVDACLKAASAPGLGGEVVNVASGHEYRIRDVADLIVALTESTSALRHSVASDRRIGTARLVADPSRAARLLGWKATTPIEAGLGRTLDWYRTAARTALPPPEFPEEA